MYMWMEHGYIHHGYMHTCIPGIFMNIDHIVIQQQHGGSACHYVDSKSDQNSRESTIFVVYHSDVQLYKISIKTFTSVTCIVDFAGIVGQGASVIMSQDVNYEYQDGVKYSSNSK